MNKQSVLLKENGVETEEIGKIACKIAILLGFSKF